MVRLSSPSGLSFEINANGSLRRLCHGDIALNLFLGNELEGGPANIYLRLHQANDGIEAVPLLGPNSPGMIRLDEHQLMVSGEWRGLAFRLSLSPAQQEAAWFWHVELDNHAAQAVTVDLIYAQDLALAHYGAVRHNEYYVSQYVDYTPLTHPQHGAVLAVRQNLPMGGRHPWALIGSLSKGVSFATDMLQLHGLATRAGGAAAALSQARLPGQRLQHEHSMAVIQDEPVSIAAGARVQRGFFGWYEGDHPAVSSEQDQALIDRALALPEATMPSPASSTGGTGSRPPTSLFSSCPVLACLDLGDADLRRLWGEDLRQCERDGDTLLSFFTGANRHVALRQKEMRVLRPHGHILRTGDRLIPDEASLTSNTWMAGVFNSLLTQGHVNINRCLSTIHGYLSVLRSSGQRIFVELEDGFHLLDVPSAFEMAPSACRWLYKYRDGLIAVRNSAAVERHDITLSIEVLSGPPRRFLIANELAINGDDGANPIPAQFTYADGVIAIRAIAESDVGRRFPNGQFKITALDGTRFEAVADDAPLFADRRSRQLPFITITTGVVAQAALRITGELIAATLPAAQAARSVPDADDLAADELWRRVTGRLQLQPSGGVAAGDVDRMGEIMPWFAHNALIHYLAPRGLEQYSGGGWGTRDVSQGPVEMLLALEDWESLRDLVMRLFRTQNVAGDWPQWFMFFERERNIRPAEAHGDIIFWPVLVLAKYLIASEDARILDEIVPYFHPEGEAQAEKEPLWAHVERALAHIDAHRIAPTELVAYGDGDWNDSLQPADPAMREHLCSAWTVTLHYEMLTTLARALRAIGDAARAQRFEHSARRVHADFQRWLIADDVLTGLAYFHPGGRLDYLLHPRDHATGIHYSLLPMMHAVINDLLSPTQAQAHVAFMQGTLQGPDGARLFDRPATYRGGAQTYFQRAESSSFFGREIGIMYTHAHLRYAEAMAHYGDVEAFFRALCQANPIAIQGAVPTARHRQANCYFSSSDAVFPDRYQAQEHYDDLLAGQVATEGGWRVYSNGAGIALRLYFESFLGLRKSRAALIVDPVIPPALNGLEARLTLAGKPLRVTYEIAAKGYGPEAVRLNGQTLGYTRESNPYRTGGVRLAMSDLEPLLKTDNHLHVALG